MCWSWLCLCCNFIFCYLSMLLLKDIRLLPRVSNPSTAGNCGIKDGSCCWLLGANLNSITVSTWSPFEWFAAMACHSHGAAVPRYSAGQQTWKSGGILSASEGLYKKLRAPGLPWPRVPVGSDCVRWRLTKTLATWCHLTENGHTPNSEWERNIRPNVQQQKCLQYHPV
jgi:hypothetical protein